MKARYYHKKKGQRIVLWVVVIIFILLGFLWALDSRIIDFSKSSTTSNEATPQQSTYASVSIKDLARNPENYIGQKVKISGTIAGWIFQFEDSETILATMFDSEGYKFNLGYNCFEIDLRDYEADTKYTAKGIIMAPEECPKKDNPFACKEDKYNYYKLSCDEPLD